MTELVRRLERAVPGGVDASTRRRAEYSSDASNYRVVPRVVVFPRHVDEVLEVASLARADGVPLTARGGGTSVAGNAVGPGIVVDFSRHLNRVLSVDPASATAVVQPGVVLGSLQAAAATHGLRFGPDPSTSSRCTVGGMIGNNACGPRAVAYGTTAANVVELDWLDGAGRRFTAGRDLDAVPGLAGLVAANLGVLRTELGRFGRQVSGYSLEHLLPERGADLAKALVGAEGTCGLLLGAQVRLVPVAAARALVVLGYRDLATAADAVPALLAHRPLAVEGMDARLVDVVRRHRGPGRVPELPAGGGWLLVEVAGDDAAAALAAAGELARSAGALDHRVVGSESEAAALWRIRADGAGLGGRTAAGAPAWPGWEDAAVPPERLGGYLRDFDALLAEHGLAGLPYGHFGDGCVHVRLDLPLAGAPERLRPFLVDAARLVASYGGSLSGEHGDGRARGELLPLMYSPAAIGLFERFKALLDPSDLMNPGVLVRPALVDADLRLPLASSLPAGGGFRFDLGTAVHRCVGVGKCRADSSSSGGFMCPSYLATRDEKDSTRGRARVLQELANGSLVRGWDAPEVHESLDLCLSCKACRSDCPAGVDVAAYKSEVLYRRYRGRLRPRTHYLLGRLPTWARLAGRAPALVNAVLAVAPLRRLLLRLGGLDPRRDPPRFARPFRRRRAPAPVAGPRGPVLLWVDSFTDAFSPGVAAAAVRLLTAAGYAVTVSAGEVCCGLTWIGTGQLDGAKARLRRLLDAFEPHARAGTPIVGLEPSCTAVLRGDLVELLGDDPRAHSVEAATRTLAELLDGWQPPDLAGVAVVAQPHCHQHATSGYDADLRLLRRAGAAVETIAGCCGLAGDFGMTAGHHDVSVAVAENGLLPALRSAPEGAVLLADGFSCRTQAAQLAGRHGVHLAELLGQHLRTAPRRR
ncbi:FAD-binding and (Fe-S)-binding domain-containing protein [Jiangella anatolica]|uniref:FAD-binding and (Fe-S)-binding domain-containing protein n=1 Tax=Jiangella anatolica TaxID=2670374 RepID=UPI001F16E4B6|nr:FAD-binding and (Fe-S)-binding domain-containing protein [Jiangella anatolica]